MKKLVKATALLLAVTVTLTACDSPKVNLDWDFGDEQEQRQSQSWSQSRSSTKPVSSADANQIYMDAPITKVENQPCVMNGSNGVYSGDWKGNRPEGEGTFWLSNNEYYSSSNWYNGFIEGQGQIRRVGSDGKVNLYNGVCARNEPAGRGTMYVGEEGDATRIVIEGDFSNTAQLLYFFLDEKGMCIDVGGYVNGGDYESYVNNPNVKGGTFLVERQLVGTTYKSRNGFYIGQVDSKGIPNGYGYYWEQYELNPSVIQQCTSNTYYAVGSWKNGLPEGYFTDVLIGKANVTEYETGFFGSRKEKQYAVTNTTRREGQIKNEELVGNCTVCRAVVSEPSRPKADGIVIETMNYDTNIKMTETHSPDETHTYTWYHMVSSTYADKGEVIKYDKNWQMTVHRTQKDGQWTTLTDLPKEKAAQREKLMEVGAWALVLGGTFAMGIVACRMANKDIDKMVAAKEKQKQANRVEYNSLVKQRDAALDKGKLEDALKLEEKVEALYYTLW